MSFLRPFFLVVVLSSIAAAAGSPLRFHNNWFVTGDYTVGGVGLRGTGSGGLATGNICIAGVPANADIIAAYLYWETIGDGHTGSFQPYGAAAASNIVGTALGTTPSSYWTRAVTVYRADVLQYFPRDANGHQLVNTSSTPCPTPASNSSGHVITLPDSGQMSTAPSTLGVSLVIVWRLPGMAYKAIVLYDGAFTLPTSGSELEQTLIGFYQASSTNPQATMTQIVGGGKPGYGDDNVTVVQVNDTEYTNPFTGSLGPSWDNFTVPVTIPGDASDVEISAESENQRVTYAAVVFSTTVQDTDGDGIPDNVERDGMIDPADGTFVNFPAMGADPNVKDVFVQLDWMLAADHNHQPKQEALNRVIAAFANAPGGPIHVHFDMGQGWPFTGGGHNVPEVPTAQCPACSVTTAWKKDFNGIKAAYFANARRNFWHYVLFAHQQPPFSDGTPNTSSGISDLPGGDSMITFGGWAPRGDPADNMVGTVDEQTGTLMHELGHTLFLKHGGASLTPNCKPNFESVMNYHFQTQGLVDNSGVIHWDYSREKLPDLTEAALNENAGLGTMLYRTRWFATPNLLDIMLDGGTGALIKPFGCKGSRSPLASGVTRKESPGTSGPLDWSNSLPDLQSPFLFDPLSSVAVDLDGNGKVEANPYSGFNDWAGIDFRQTNGRVNQANGELANGELANGELQADGELANGVGEYDFDDAVKQIPAAPAGLTASVSTGQVSLTWTPVQLKIINSYRIYRLDAAHPLGVQIGTVSGSPPSASFTDTSVSPGTAYTYFVTDVDDFGNQSSYSNVVTVTAQ